MNRPRDYTVAITDTADHQRAYKAWANFEWDRPLETDMISKEYLDGCYQLGQQYPDLPQHLPDV